MDPAQNEAGKRQSEYFEKIINKIFTYPAGHKFLSNKKFLAAGGIVLLFLILIPVILLLFASNKEQKTAQKSAVTTQVKEKPKPTSSPQINSRILVYGAWTGNTSVIRALDLTTGQTKTLATLPVNIKKVSVLSNSTLLYIDQTDSHDNGERISIFNTKEKQTVATIPADPGYGIDDYVLSPNNQYLTFWEVQFAPNAQTLQGGRSRVYTVNLAHPSVTNLLYDEEVSPAIPIHDPIAMLNNGTVFTDKRIPNDTNGGAGWAYGMSLSAFDGTNKQDIQSMTNGTYGSQPTLSPDGKFLLFAGYDGKNGDGTDIKNGYRQAILTPDTIELLDTQTLKRYKLPNLTDTNIYSAVQWDKQTGNIVFSLLSSDSKQMGIYSYNLEKLSDKQIPLPVVNGMPYGYISALPAGKILIGTQSTNEADFGNLGPVYAFAYTQLAISNSAGKLSYISSPDPFIQYITILPENYFNTVLAAQTGPQNTLSPTVPYGVLQGTDTRTGQNNASLKTTLFSTRLKENSSSTCINLESMQCFILGFTQKSETYTICQNTEKAIGTTTNACY
jgi:hypothetical protein